MLEQGASRRGRDTPCRLRSKKGRAQRFLHVADAGAGRGQREMRPLGPVGDASGLDHMAKKAQIRQVELHRFLRLARRQMRIIKNCAERYTGQTSQLTKFASVRGLSPNAHCGAALVQIRNIPNCAIRSECHG